MQAAQEKITISLNNLEFFAHHGWHNEEALAGGNFLIDIGIDFYSPKEITHLDDTINYVNVYSTIKSIVAEPVPLLETLCSDICDAVHKLDDRITTINISVSKLNAPIINFIGQVSVSLKRIYKTD